MSAETITSQTRQEFMSSRGFLLYTDVGDRLLRHMAAQPILPVDERPWMSLTDQEEPKDFQAFYLVSRSFTRSISSSHRLYGITEEDKSDAKKHTFAMGVEELSFSWNFAPALAVATINSFVETGKITAEDARQLTLGDWADVIGSGWFSKLAHQFAMTGNGMFGRFGTAYNDYTGNALREKLSSRAGEDLASAALFDVREEVEPDEPRAYLTATLTEPFRNLLRTFRSSQTTFNGGSVGCPVARRSAMVDREYVHTNPHARRLQALSIIAVSDSEEAKVAVSQEWTAIDKTLSFIAGQLDTYDRKYGTPVLELTDHPIKELRIRHTRAKQTDLLWKSIDCGSTASQNQS